MRILPPFEEKIRHSIRDELAKKPTITMTALKEELESQFGRDFHFSYLRKLVGKVRNEISYEIDSAAIAPRMAELRENYRVMREELLKIVYWNPLLNDQAGMPKPLARDRVEAAKSVVQLDLAVLAAEAAAGLYKKPIAEIAKDMQYDPLPPETRMVVIAAWQRGGLLPTPVIEEMVPAIAMPISSAPTEPPVTAPPA
jgi:hypothetical protein